MGLLEEAIPGIQLFVAELSPRNAGWNSRPRPWSADASKIRSGSSWKDMFKDREGVKPVLAHRRIDTHIYI